MVFGRWIQRAVPLVAVATALVVVGCGSSDSSGASDASAKSGSSGKTVTLIGAGGADFSSVDIPYFADQLKKAGLNVKFSYVGDVSSAVRALVSGQADLLINAIPDEILAINNGGANTRLIAANNQASDYVIIGKPGTTLQNVAGKTLAIDTPGSAGHVSAILGLSRAGADAKAVRAVTIGNSSAREQAILAGKVDLAPVHYPLALQAEATKKAVDVLDIGKELGPYLQSGLWANEKFLQDRATAQKVVDTFIDTERWAAKNKQQYIEWANKNEDTAGGLTKAQQSKVWDYFTGLNFFGVNGGICPKYIDSTIKLNQQLGVLPKTLKVTKDQWLDASFVQAYLKKENKSPDTC